MNETYRAIELGKKLGKAVKEKKSENKIRLFIKDLSIISKHEAIDRLIIICLQHEVDAKVLIENFKSTDHVKAKLINLVISGAQEVLSEE